MLTHLLNNPTETYSIRELARETGISHTWIAETVEDLVEHGLVSVEETPTTKQVSATRNEQFRQLKQSVNLYRVYESGIVDELINAYSRPNAIVLIGSYAEGEDTEQSDIDIAVLTARSETLDLSRYEEALHHPINIQEVSPENITDEFMNTVANGITLYGYVEVNP